MSASKLKIWIDASRPKTLAAAFVPVLVGVAVAFAEFSTIHWPATLVAITCAFLIQIGTNFANDYFDFIKGADTNERIGFTRATAAGLVPAKTMLIATIICMGIAFVLGLYLVYIGGWTILIIGILSLIFGILYTGGPFPLGYNGLGDVFVFIFFGIIAVTATVYVNALRWSIDAFWASLAVGALCTNILAVNNLRDINQDRIAGKRTLGVLFGENTLKWEYTLMVLLAFAIPPHFYFQLDYNLWSLLPFISAPLAIKLVKTIWTNENKSELNKTLEQTAKFMVIFSILFSLGLIL